MRAHSMVSAGLRGPLLIGGLLVGLCAPARAFDGKLKGLLLGIGLGPNCHRIHESGPDANYIVIVGGPTGDSIVVSRGRYNATKSGAGATIQLQLGYGFSEHFQVYYSELEDLEYVSTYNSKVVQTLTALSSLALDYRPGSAAAPWFLSGGIGQSSHLYNGEGHGFGFFAGGGRDLGRQSQIRLLLAYGRPLMYEASSVPLSGATTVTASLILGMLWR